MVPKTRTSRRNIWIVAFLLSATLLTGLLVYLWQRRRTKPGLPQPSATPEIDSGISQIEGLSNAEAAARKPEIDIEALKQADKRKFRRKAVRQNLFTTFNLDLFGMAFILFLLGSPEGALGTLLVVAINLGLNLFQENFTKKELDKRLENLQPKATAIRERRIKSVELADIVPGDLLVIGPGDQILVDGEIIGEGEILVDESTVEQQERQLVKQAGDHVSADSFCVDGNAIYRSSQAGADRLADKLGSGIQILMGERTPLQRFIEIVLRVLFVIVLVFSVLLVFDAIYDQAEIVSAEYRDAFSIVFGIAPTSLFFILVINYAVGLVRIADQGALVYKSATIESLANVSVLCITRSSLLSGAQVSLEPIEQPEDFEPLSENLIRRILGDFAHSVPLYSEIGRMVNEALPGIRRTPISIAPLLASHGWYGATFDDPGLRGTFVIAHPDVLESQLLEDKRPVLEIMGESITEAQRGFRHWWRRVTRRDQGNGDAATAAEAAAASEAGSQDVLIRETLVSPETTVSAEASEEYSALETTASDLPSEEEQKLTFGKRLLTLYERLIVPLEERGAEDEQDVEEAPKGDPLLFAYLPDPVPLYKVNRQPQLPQNLIQLARLYVSETIDPETRETIQALSDAGMAIKIMSADSIERTAATANELGLADESLEVLSGEALLDMDAQAFDSVVMGSRVIGQLSPSQKAEVLKSLRSQGEFVGMLGNNIGDVPALRQANVRITMKTGSQAALMLTDMVLLDDSLAALPRVLRTGQRLVQGLLNTFKLYLSNVFAQLLLVATFLILRLEEFPYHPTQAGVISAFGIAFPSMFLVFWSSTGRMTRETMRRSLEHYIFPAGILTSILGLAVFYLFRALYADIEYVQLVVVWALLFAAWLRVLFLLPPTKFWVGGEPFRGDKRIVWLVLIIVLIFAVIAAIPLALDLLRIAWLTAVLDYVLIALAVVIWAFILRATWRASLTGSLVDYVIKDRSDPDINIK
jgi:magnesium-transporting ATPase (P-type)